MPIDIYMFKFSPSCRAVLMTAKELKIDLNEKIIDMSEGQHLTEQYLKINPTHTIPAIDDDGFILWESRAIMQYLCNKYAPDSPLYPSDPKQRAIVDRWLITDITTFALMKEAIGKPQFGFPTSEEAIKKFHENFKLIEQLIGQNKYLAGNNKTIADLSMLASTSDILSSGTDLTAYPNFKRWITDLSEELPYHDQINNFDKEEISALINKIKQSMAKKDEI